MREHDMNILRELQALESNVIKLREGTSEMHVAPALQANDDDVRRGKRASSMVIRATKRHVIDNNPMRARPPVAPKPVC